MRLKIAIATLLLAQIACAIAPGSIATTPRNGSQTGGNAPATAAPTPDTPRQEFAVLAPVWVRDYAGDKMEAVTGGTFGGWCVGDWCYIVELQRKVWRGCTDHADGRGCENE